MAKTSDAPPPEANESSKPPRSLAEYLAWARAALDSPHDETTKRWYELNATAALNTAQAHPFFKSLSDELEAIDAEYQRVHGVELLMDDQLSLVTKPYASMLDKSLRWNVLNNGRFPAAPDKGWLQPHSWFRLNNDIVRSVLTCKYMDGPRFLAERLATRATQQNIPHRSKSQQNDDGYYAYHFYVKLRVELTTSDWKTDPVDVEIEVQITTQLQEVLRALTHRSYEVRRLVPDADQHSWKWERDSERFQAAYLNHRPRMSINT